ncbi:aminotransferase class V-fold PLP-dependent enzyme [Clostridium baratii]|uniref:aminotransferase class V-fold PLP-dependent enzyme n=1 Tax=Clostridium baratii TaxID=1561 RepID=UPI003D3276F0
MENVIYLDNAATTYPKPECVYESVNQCMRNFGVNAGRGSYSLSRKATSVIDEFRKEVIDLVNLQNYNKVIVQPSATIAINQILNGIEWDDIKNVYVTPFEHNAIMRTLKYIKNKNNININIIPFNNLSLELKEEEFKRMILRDKADLILISQVSNTTGLILPVEKIIEIGKKEDTLILVDASQALGLIDIDMKKLDIDFLVFAGHKTLYGPFGIGGFVYNSNYKLKEFITGGTGSNSTELKMPSDIPYKYEAGSYNIEAIFGALSGIKWIKSNDIKKLRDKESELTKYCVEKLKEIYGIELYVPEDDEKHIGIISFNINSYKADELSNILDEDFDICVRAGHHCAPLVGDFLGDNAKEGVLRVSLSYFNDKQDIDRLIDALEELV